MSEPVKSSAILLHTVKWGDSGCVLQLLDSEAGRTSMMLRGLGKDKKNPNQGSLFNLSILDIVSSASPKSSMPTVREYEPKVALNEIRTDLNKSVIALFISELLYRSIREGDGDAALFGWICEAILRLDAEEGSCANFHLWFLVEFSRRLGFFPKENYSAADCRFDVTAARFISDPAATEVEHNGGIVFPQRESVLLHIICTSTLDEVLALPLTGRQRSDFAARCIDFLSTHLECLLNIKSLNVLREIFE